MRILLMWLYAEGPTDERFLPVLIRRAAAGILRRSGTGPVEVPLPTIVSPEPLGDAERREDRILRAAKEASDAHLLVVHSDADDRSRQRALEERCLPGFRRVAGERASGSRLCGELVPVIPVRMTEAWMLADHEVLADALGRRLEPGGLGLPTAPRRVESIPDPKSELRRLLRQVQGRRRERPVGVLYEPIAQRVRLEMLERVPAYAEFVGDLTAALSRAGFLA
jgi:hypothetical protein